ncbi:DUF7674 family protein [Puia dinghuensis]|uniref:DUF7674 domain-containing protein n=1 Tax=Puia dinghuensis TaxID=1792502 RepID=A0A8J2XUZ1_9BACT|nr:hypothetical protein [Puia dinghuensis]GGB15223.1 hypothetical protein GCM10011511_43700 [Puia dinghuensis]
MFSQQEMPALIQLLTDFTKRMALEHDFQTVRKCMTLMGRLYEKGNMQTRNAIENIFIYSFSTMMCSCNIVEWKVIRAAMPEPLYALYVQQVSKP